MHIVCDECIFLLHKRLLKDNKLSKFDAINTHEIQLVCCTHRIALMYDGMVTKIAVFRSHSGTPIRDDWYLERDDATDQKRHFVCAWCSGNNWKLSWRDHKGYQTSWVWFENEGYNTHEKNIISIGTELPRTFRWLVDDIYICTTRIELMYQNVYVSNA